MAMDTYRSTVFERTTLTFCIEGLQAREELLVKAFIRLLDHLTHQQWRYQPPDDKAHIDLLFANAGGTETFEARHGKLPPAVLELTDSGASGHGLLSWPLRPDALEKELNRLGGLATTAPVGTDVTQAADSVLLFPSAATSQALETDAALKLMRLKRWPPARLLVGTGRMRLATLLTGRAMALDELVQRSSLPHRACQTFVNELQQAGLLLYPTPSQAAVESGSSAVSSDAQVTPSPEHSNQIAARRYDTHSARMPSQTAVRPSLLARIRIRLGIGNAGQ